MKHDRQCPKCKGRNVGYAQTPSLYSSALSFNDTSVAIERWLCTECGYTETYVVELDHDWSKILDVYYGTSKDGPFR